MKNRRRSGPVALLVAVVMGLVLSVAPAAAAKPPNQGDLQQMSQQVRSLIKVVEASKLPCETRNAVVHRLRLLNDNIESGRRTAARMMLQSWMDNARTSVATGVISPQLGASLNNAMGDIQAKIGTGWPEKPKATRQWKPLPTCPTATGLDANMDFTSDDLLILINGALKTVPKVGSLLAAFVTVLWPSSGDDVSSLIDQAIDDFLVQQLQDDLAGLEAASNLFLTRVSNWQRDCPNWEDPKTWGNDYTTPCYTGASATSQQWWTTYTVYTTARPHFQSATPKDYRVTLLPLFAQFENLLISLLREGMLLEPYWNVKGVLVDPSDAAEPRLQMARELDPNRADDIGVSYVDMVYQLGLDQQPQPTTQDKWVQRNNYERAMITQVLDFRDSWRYLDPGTYPDGLPGGVKLTRMILSDPIGHVQNWDGFAAPANVLGPMNELTVWLQRLEFELSTGATSAIEAVQATSPPSGGPARPGPVTGDASLDLGGAIAGTNTYYYDLRRSGPIVSVAGRQDRFNVFYYSIANALGLTFANGGTSWIGSKGTDVGTFHFPGYIAATAKAIGRYEIGGGHTADSVVFGFRRADSFLASSSVLSTGGLCLNTAGAAVSTTTCNAGPAQIWGYYAGTKALVNGAGTCLTASGSSVSAAACTEAVDQRWEFAAGAGQIRAVAGGLVLQANADGSVVAAPADGGSDQVWSTPPPQIGPIHGIGQGRCLTIAGRTDGSAAVMYTCDQPGSSSDLQQWAFDAGAGTLRILGGTKCLQAGGTTANSPAVISACTGARNQQWLVDPATNLITAVNSGLVLSVSGGATANGTPAVLRSYDGGYSQFWSRPSDQGEALFAIGAGKCLNAPASLSGTQATVEVCASYSGQQWVYHPITQRLTAFDGRTTGGTTTCLALDSSGVKAVLAPCSSAADQGWVLARGSDNVTSFVQHVATGKCLTLPGSGTVTAAGTKVEVQACRTDATQVNQQWQYGGVS